MRTTCSLIVAAGLALGLASTADAKQLTVMAQQRGRYTKLTHNVVNSFRKSGMKPGRLIGKARIVELGDPFDRGARIRLAKKTGNTVLRAGALEPRQVLAIPVSMTKVTTRVRGGTVLGITSTLIKGKRTRLLLVDSNRPSGTIRIKQGSRGRWLEHAFSQK